MRTISFYIKWQITLLCHSKTVRNSSRLLQLNLKCLLAPKPWSFLQCIATYVYKKLTPIKKKLLTLSSRGQPWLTKRHSEIAIHASNWPRLTSFWGRFKIFPKDLSAISLRLLQKKCGISFDAQPIITPVNSGRCIYKTLKFIHGFLENIPANRSHACTVHKNDAFTTERTAPNSPRLWQEKC